MKAEHRDLIGQAIAALTLRDVMLHECSFKRPAPPPTQSTDLEARQLLKRQVKFVIGNAPVDDDLSIRLLQVVVELGVRVTGAEEQNPPIYFEIEADFMVEYEIKSEVSEEALKLFADINSVHNVWPFWRQHVFDVVSRGRLPHLDVPLFSGLPPAATRT
jgi:preprotein translocase subunit SecB